MDFFVFVSVIHCVLIHFIMTCENISLGITRYLNSYFTYCIYLLLLHKSQLIQEKKLILLIHISSSNFSKVTIIGVVYLK